MSISLTIAAYEAIDNDARLQNSDKLVLLRWAWKFSDKRPGLLPSVATGYAWPRVRLGVERSKVYDLLCRVEFYQVPCEWNQDRLLLFLAKLRRTTFLTVHQSSFFDHAEAGNMFL